MYCDALKITKANTEKWSYAIGSNAAPSNAFGLRMGSKCSIIRMDVKKGWRSPHEMD